MTMNALFPEPVNEITPRICEIRAIAGRCCPTVRDVAATQALCAPSYGEGASMLKLGKTSLPRANVC